ncbi:hypothetical protein BEI59_13900 [Eisenbergiella tayi]|uniref:Uncharacterized protein n=1 Tax=Eisenbergiella tayi TaxID=1432052 RepID=A0A1E3UJD5_9FIRM|nr:hypothetical protein BEI59_13900 [Eisenbergiella tayi]ODR54487.1 hypothetical protein BEI63_16125 [Eisenbergiella tayi]
MAAAGESLAAAFFWWGWEPNPPIPLRRLAAAPRYDFGTALSSVRPRPVTGQTVFPVRARSRSVKNAAVLTLQRTQRKDRRF